MSRPKLDSAPYFREKNVDFFLNTDISKLVLS